MSWSYSGNPSSSDRDKVRFTIGDTDSCQPMLQDEEIDYLLSVYISVGSASYQSAQAILAKLSKEYNQSVGSVSYSLSDRVGHYKQLVDKLKAESFAVGALPYCGGISISDKEAKESNPDRVEPKFTIDLHKNVSISLGDDEE